MIELFLLLIGARIVRRKWWILFSFGSAWMLLGFLIFGDAMTDDRIPPIYFIIPLVIDAAISLLAAFGTSGTLRSLRIGKAVLFLSIVLVVVEAPWHEDMIVGILSGTFMFADAAWRGASAYVVRSARWRLLLAGAVFEFLMGIWAIVPWPTNWAGEVGADAGMLIVVSGAGLCGLGLRIRRLPRNMPMSAILTRGWPSETEEASPQEASSPQERVPGTVTIHVWTPTGALAPVGIRRYVVAFNEQGGLSTGHAALDASPDIYISHYPAAEISREQSAFKQTLRATPSNDVPGSFQSTYAEESADWCPSTKRVRLEGLDIRAILAFWKAYRRDTTYNLTNRNCSSGVAKALDAGLEGMFEVRARSPYFLMRLLFLPELWVAGVLRRRAAAMAWTPGMVLDYARAVRHVIRLADRLRS